MSGRFVGVDVSATRGFDLCALDDARRVALLVRARDLDAVAILARGLPREAVIAIDAPPAPSRGLVEGKRYRVAERALMSLGVALYPVPASPGESPAWMQAGYALYQLLEANGFPTVMPAAPGAPESGCAVECYPHLTYLALTGAHRGRTSKAEWSRASLRGRVTGLPADLDQDALDAAAAALTAWHFSRGEWIGFGDPSEGVIVAPRTKHDLASLGRGGGSAQLALPIGDGAGAAPDAPMRPASFGERVLRVVARIPAGRVATYGDVARWAGKPGGARAVGTLMARHAFEVPCHRVVDAAGKPAAYPEDAAARLRAEGVPFDGARVDLAAARWGGPR